MRILITILLCCYLTATFGISSVEHYCDGHYAGITFWGFFGNNKCECAQKKAKNAKKCCKEKFYFSKINSEHSHSVAELPIFPPLLLAILPATEYICKSAPSAIENLLPNEHAPPNVFHLPIYLICRKLLI